MSELHFLNHSNLACRFSGHPSATVQGVSTAATPPIETAQIGEPAGQAGQALVPSPQALEAETAAPATLLTMRLPVELEVAIPVRGFRVRNLLALATGAVVESQWVHGDDVPLAAGDVQLAWSEFEVVDTQLAVRLTRLA